ncbi:hypothetical protein [Natrinema halophilum]|uniref:hypothetical protein n=1 Tax=Natrinema halophilum TaxID=1699371 RepID=UPI001F42151B|nr:hypothetical protein [Natrinema halophilum]UHQ96003.1 hypothetical protein HYG82_21225 [Natrinema halophilum]
MDRTATTGHPGDVGSGHRPTPVTGRVPRGPERVVQPETFLDRFVGDSETWNLEPLLLRNFAQYAAGAIDEPRSIWHLLSVVQHY